jgi:phage/plasmid-like protein (TIGR03299 family)
MADAIVSVVPAELSHIEPVALQKLQAKGLTLSEILGIFPAPAVQPVVARQGKKRTNVPTDFAGSKVPWHKVGNPLPERIPHEMLTSFLPRVMASAGLDWEPYKAQSYFRDERASQYVLDSESFKVIRDTPTGPVILANHVGNDYRVIKNADTVAFLFAVSEGIGTMETLGYFGDGQQVFGCLRLGDQQLINGDKIHPYVVFRNSHDSSCEFEAWRSTIRPECGNMLQASRSRATKEVGMVRVRHEGDTNIKIEDAQKALKILVENSLNDVRRFDELLLKDFSIKQMEEYAVSLFPGDGTATKDRRADLSMLFLHGTGHDKLGQNAYAALQSVTQYIDHGGRRVNALKGDTVRAQNSRQAESLMLGKGAQMKTYAFNTICDMVGVL